ncbi:hypothetical protein PIB30_024129 [Stylosanthes scabra]|uniref:BRO1 domain-containing protein n=1 Tax=Stylosanthes scabra TaxID=79078 RepID=A0ABU6WBJ2_9FABA|nr:hypothetical protein [Stylosanthes scabra]
MAKSNDVPMLNQNPNPAMMLKIPVKKSDVPILNPAIPVKKSDVPNPNPNPAKMLAIPVKKSDPVELYYPLRNLVARKYSELDAQKVESILQTLNKCRSNINMVERVDLSLPMQRNCLIHYFKCLSMVEPLFTAVSSSISSNPDRIIFFWYDAFDPDYICLDKVSSQHSNIQLEKAAVLFNLGAIYSQIGASCDSTTALGRHLAIDAFNAAAHIFLKLWKDFSKEVSATLDLTVLFAECLHHLFSAQASELNLLQQLDDDKNNNDVGSALEKHRCAVSFKSVSKLYRRAYDLILSDSAATEHIYSFDKTWVTHLYQKAKFFQVEARQRKSSIIPASKRPKTSSLVQCCPVVHDAESVTEILVRGICRRSDQWIPKQQLIYLDLILSEYCPFKIADDGKLVVDPWDMPPPYPTTLAILSSSSSSHILALPLKKSQPLDLYEPLRSYLVLKCSESAARRVEGLLETLAKLRDGMQSDDLSLPARRDCLISYFKCLCMIEPLFPMTESPNPPIFVWYNAFNPQENSSQHNIYLEKASILFNLGALCTQIAASCDLTTIQGYRVAIDALNEASHWFLTLQLEATKAPAITIDLSEDCAKMLCEILSAEISDSKWNFPHPQSARLTLPGYPVSVLYRKAYALSTSGPLAENLAQTLIPQYLESKMNMKTCIVETGPGDVIEQFLSGYSKAKSLLSEGCQPPCLDLLSEVSPVKIKDGNLVANATLEALRLALKEMSLQETSDITMKKN